MKVVNCNPSTCKCSKCFKKCEICEGKNCSDYKNRPCKMFNNLDVWRSIELFNTYKVTKIKKKFLDEYKKEAAAQEARLKADQQKLF